MICRLKKSALGLVAGMVMSAVAIAPAQASELHATTIGAASIFGQQTSQLTFTTAAGTVRCNQALLEGAILGGSTAQHLGFTATNTGCTAWGLAAQVLMNGCKYTTTGAGQPALTARVDIAGCTSGKVIEIKTAICTMTVPEQSGLSHIVLANVFNSPHDVNATMTVSSIVYQAHGISPFNCPGMAATEQRSDGTLTGQATIQARTYGGVEQKTLHNHQYQQFAQNGASIGLLAT